MKVIFFKIFLLVVSAFYIVSFLELDECERNQNYNVESHAYVISVNSPSNVNSKNIHSNKIGYAFSPVALSENPLLLFYQNSFHQNILSLREHNFQKLYLDCHNLRI